ncbi:hypothetical protein EXIGLDRAFT_732913 [Exidia glandulosa HHB12029]|uniref:Uncharacterized protein n=1 Tax=Exidia glandulosa HHB12029 TaxID=1314781 RepID=A0A165PTZ9_EXIGL|nr:hypothetical protein EXIGLDRAFT_732913 [Exidia glandulosa HHB12029]
MDPRRHHAAAPLLAHCCSEGVYALLALRSIPDSTLQSKSYDYCDALGYNAPVDPPQPWQTLVPTADPSLIDLFTGDLGSGTLSLQSLRFAVTCSAHGSLTDPTNLGYNTLIEVLNMQSLRVAT